MSKITVEESNLVAVADSIRSKGGTSGSLKFPEGFISAVGNIKAEIPNNYINLADVIMHCTKSASGTFTGSGQTCEKLSIGLSFRPKVILIIATNPVTTTNGSSPYEICAVWRIMNDNYSKLIDNCVFVYKSGSSVKSGHTQSSGLRGNADNTITGWGTVAKFASGTTYSWYAWG